MGTAGKMARAQEAVSKAGTLAEAQSILDKLVEEEQEVSDIFYMQEEMIGSLQDLLSEQDKAEPVYVQQTPTQVSSSSNMIYIVIGLIIFFLTRNMKL